MKWKPVETGWKSLEGNGDVAVYGVGICVVWLGLSAFMSRYVLDTRPLAVA